MKPLFYILILFVTLCSCDDIVGVTDISQEQITILAPTKDAMVTQSDVTFTWDAILDAENYHLQIASPSFANATQILEDTLLLKRNFTKTLNAGNYEWRVNAQNSGYVSAYTITPFSVLVEIPDISATAITIKTPADGTTFTTSDTVNFTWDALTGADTYQIQIASPDFTDANNIIETQTLTETSFSKAGLEAKDYLWRVKADNSISETVYTTGNFKVN